jgi:hypothetical protein
VTVWQLTAAGRFAKLLETTNRVVIVPERDVEKIMQNVSALDHNRSGFKTVDLQQIVRYSYNSQGQLE